MTIKLECIASGHTLAEASLWSAETGSLLWLDIGVPSRLYEWRQHDKRIRTWRLPELATALVQARDGELLVVTQGGVQRFDDRRGELQMLAPAGCPLDLLRFNDAGCDRQGRLWVGTMPNDFAGVPQGPTGGIWRIDPNLSYHLLAEGFGCPNTFAWSADGATFYLADSARGEIGAYEFDGTKGTLGERRTFAAPLELGIPDGSAMDTEGCLWNARWGAGCVARFAPDGSIISTISVPASQVTSCAFGGENLDTLFITTANFGLSSASVTREPLSGGIFSCKPGPRGALPGRFNVAV